MGVPTIASENYPLTINDFYNMVEPILAQELRAARLKNNLSDADAVYFIDGKERTGQVVESSIVAAAQARGFNPNDYSLAATDPTVYTVYANDYENYQFAHTVRKDDVRRVIADKGATQDDLVFAIVNALSEGFNAWDFKNRRKLIFESPVKDYSENLGGQVPKTMRGVLYAARDMYNHIIANNSDLTGEEFESSCPREDVRIALSSKLMNLVDVVEMAHIFNMEKEELFGKLVIVNMDDLPESQWYKIVAYDRHAMNVCEFLYDFSQDIVGRGRYTNHYLTVSEMYFYNNLFKAAALDATAAATAGLTDMLQDRTQYTVTPTLNSVATLEPAPGSNITANLSLYTKVVPVEGKSLEDLTVAVTMTSDITNSVYNAETGEILIPAVTANVTITVTEG